MSELGNIDVARTYLSKLIGNGIEYRAYCEKELAGDFAVDVYKLITKIEKERDELKAENRAMSQGISDMTNELRAQSPYRDLFLQAYTCLTTLPQTEDAIQALFDSAANKAQEEFDIQHQRRLEERASR